MWTSPRPLPILSVGPADNSIEWGLPFAQKQANAGEKVASEPRESQLFTRSILPVLTCAEHRPEIGHKPSAEVGGF